MEGMGSFYPRDVCGSIRGDPRTHLTLCPSKAAKNKYQSSECGWLLPGPQFPHGLGALQGCLSFIGKHPPPRKGERRAGLGGEAI